MRALIVSVRHLLRVVLLLLLLLLPFLLSGLPCLPPSPPSSLLAPLHQSLPSPSHPRALSPTSHHGCQFAVSTACTESPAPGSITIERSKPFPAPPPLPTLTGSVRHLLCIEFLNLLSFFPVSSLVSPFLLPSPSFSPLHRCRPVPPALRRCRLPTMDEFALSTARAEAPSRGGGAGGGGGGGGRRRRREGQERVYCVIEWVQRAPPPPLPPPPLPPPLQ